jgi:uncharacterized membrane protein YgcG
MVGMGSQQQSYAEAVNAEQEAFQRFLRGQRDPEKHEQPSPLQEAVNQHLLAEVVGIIVPPPQPSPLQEAVDQMGLQLERVSQLCEELIDRLESMHAVLRDLLARLAL